MEINLLLLGQTGVGKSTFINGFQYYLTHPSLTEAESKEILFQIPISFKKVDANYEVRDVTIGSDVNESRNADQSCTQFPKTYRFSFDDVIVRVIDTPGMGDTRGIEKDKENFMNMLSHISMLEKLNGICILLKPNEARLTPSIEYCIKELLTNLHKDACHNIVFCFTDCRSTSYTPGDSYNTLKVFIKKNNIDVKLGKETTYCVDNEAIRYLAEVKSGIKIGDKDRRSYCKSWDQSVLEIHRLLEHIASRKSHVVKDSLSINDTRRMILSVIEPMAEITEKIQKHSADIDEYEQHLKNSAADKLNLANNLYIPKCETRTESLNPARYVCTSEKCTREKSSENETRIMSECSRNYDATVKGDITSFAAVLSYRPMLYSSRKPIRTVVLGIGLIPALQCAIKTVPCKNCGCAEVLHRIIFHQVVAIKTKQINSEVQEKIIEADTADKRIAEHLKLLELERNNLQQEQQKIIEASAQFACFLKTNAIVPYNDAMGSYLEYSIKISGENTEVHRRLVQVRQNYVRELEHLQNELKHSTAVNQPTPVEMKKVVDELKAMENFGKLIKDVETVDEIALENLVRKNEVLLVVKPEPRSNTPQLFLKLKTSLQST